MKTAFKLCAWLMLIALVVSIGLVIAGAAWLLPLDRGVITIDGDSITLGALHGADWVLAVVGVFVAIIVVGLVVPLAVVLPLLAMLAVLGVAALFFSPLLLVVWVVWRLVRSDNKPRANAGATIAA
jgi:hypothetical protein